MALNCPSCSVRMHVDRTRVLADNVTERYYKCPSCATRARTRETLLTERDSDEASIAMSPSEREAVLGWIEQHIDTNKALRSWRDPTRGGLLMAEVHTVQPGPRARVAMTHRAAHRSDLL